MPKKLSPSARTSTPSGRQQVNFRIDADLLKRIDDAAENLGISRSELFLKAAEMVCDLPDLLMPPAPAIDARLEALIEKKVQQALDATLDPRLDGMEDRILGKSAA
jgi:antitoxin component of RelBE/YafQ-DinJ toxin-antitoxin module